MKVKCIIVLSITMLSLIGCQNKIEIDEQKEDIVLEYMAGLILKYDGNYRPTFLKTNIDNETDLSIVEKNDDVKELDQEEITIAPSKPPNGGENHNNIDDKLQFKSLNSIITKDGIDFKYKGFKRYQQYPESKDAYFSLSPRKNYELLVLKFEINNTSDREIKLNMTELELRYKLMVNKDVKFKPLLTLLENDLQYLNTSIKAKEKDHVILVFEIENKIKINELEMAIEKGKDIFGVKLDLN